MKKDEFTKKLKGVKSRPELIKLMSEARSAGLYPVQDKELRSLVQAKRKELRDAVIAKRRAG